MNIGIDARFATPLGTGLGKYTEKLIENLERIDKKNKYFIFLGESNWDYLKLTSKNFIKVSADIPWYSLEEQIKLPRIFASQNLDLLHVPHFNVPIFYKGKFVVTIHDLIHHQFMQDSTTTRNVLIFGLKRLGYRIVISQAIKNSVKIITPSSYVKRQIVRTFGVNSEKIAVTHEAAEEEYFSDTPNLIRQLADKNQNLLTRYHIQEPFLIYVGNVYPHKNLPNLLDAIDLLKNVNLVVVCPRDVFTKRLENEIKSRNLENRVKTVGYLPAKELVALFSKAKAYVFPSLSEGFGLPGLNAMASELPVAASNIPALREIYSSAAIYFNPNDPKDITQKITQALKNLKLRQRLIKNGRGLVKKYSWHKMAKKTLDIYEKSWKNS